MHCRAISRLGWIVVTAAATTFGCAAEGGSGDDEDTGSTGADDDADDDDSVSATTPDDDGPEDTGPEDTGPEDTGPDDTGPDTDTEGNCDVEFPGFDDSTCAPLATDFVPDSADDPYDACVADSGEWTLIADAPGAAARVEAYEGIIELLRGADTPTADDFTDARALYATDNGLESRVLRREDLHYPPVAPADVDPKVEFDQQCTILSNQDAYPDRCVGPNKMQPIIDEAFAAGMSDEGDAAVNAARIDATLQWFLWVSTYKESASCVPLPEDCDAHWAYYGGGTDRDNPLGVGLNIREISENAHNAIYDAMLGVLCWRDLNPGDADPTWEELGQDGQDQFLAVHAQLDDALWHGWARLVRSYLESQDPASCSSEADANWAFLQVAGPVLTPEAEARDAAAAGDLTGIWEADAPPDEAGLQAAVAAIDAIFPCPQCESCTPETEWGY